MIKYRVWDNRQKTYQSNSGANGYQGNNIWFIKVEDYEVLEQFTGLQDKNGVDIYVGDIVKYIVATHKTDEKLNRYILGEIVFANLVGKFMLKTTDNNHYDFREIQTNVKLEVIGNINENKELLENE